MKSKLLVLFCWITYFGVMADTNGIYKDIPYVPVNSSTFDHQRHVLDVYSPRLKDALTEVVIFIHGGKWKMGNKEMFNYVGINFAEKGKTAVLINYRLSPSVTYDEMAMDCARAVKWVYSQIEFYGGNKAKLYLYGHSSGGHLASLISSNPRFFEALEMENPIKGCVLIDAFGMDMYNFLQKPTPENEWMFDTFTKDEIKWKDASPSQFVDENTPKFLLFVGERTHDIIYKDVKKFSKLLEDKGIPADITEMNKKKHMLMIGQMIDFRNEIYEKCITFMSSD